MSYSAKDLHTLLAANPDLAILGNGTIGAPVVELPKLSEFDMQTLAFAEVKRRALTSDDWAMIVAIPNGQYRPGQRLEPGVRRGFPDILVPIARHSRNGLALELKVSPNKPTADQLWWHRQLRLRNWAVDVIYDDWQKVIEHIAWYL